MTYDEIEAVLGVSQVRAIESALMAALAEAEFAGHCPSLIDRTMRELLTALLAAHLLSCHGGGVAAVDGIAHKLRCLLLLSEHIKSERSEMAHAGR